MSPRDKNEPGRRVRLFRPLIVCPAETAQVCVLTDVDDAARLTNEVQLRKNKTLDKSVRPPSRASFPGSFLWAGSPQPPRPIGFQAREPGLPPLSSPYLIGKTPENNWLYARDQPSERLLLRGGNSSGRGRSRPDPIIYELAGGFLKRGDFTQSINVHPLLGKSLYKVPAKRYTHRVTTGAPRVATSHPRIL